MHYDHDCAGTRAADRAAPPPARPFDADPTAEADLSGPRAFRLGMQHLDGAGINRGWLLRKTCHLHWWSICRRFGCPPTGLTDPTGARVLASVVACGVHGIGAGFREDDLVELRLIRSPTADNGWLSQTDLVGRDGAVLRVEIATAFVRRRDASNRSLEPATLPDAAASQGSDEDRRRADLFRLLGASDRAIAEADDSPPHLTIPIRAPQHFNGVGLVYFAQLHDFVAEAEANALPPLGPALPVANRRVHYFGNLDAGDRLELVSRASVQALAPMTAVVVRSHGRRGSDGKVILCAETLYRL